MTNNTMVVLGSKEELFLDIMAGMNSLRKENSLYDVRILVKGQEITAHKSVLAPVSDYFKSLFLGPFKTDSAIVEVDFSSVALDIESAEAVVDYLYTGTIEINDDNLEAILKLATFLLIKQLQVLCIKFMEQSCDLNSNLRYFVLAVDYMVPEAEELVVKIVKSRFHDWFMFGEAAKSLSLCHLQKLATNYSIFEHCSKIDTLSFLVDWVLSGKSEQHEAFACKILDPKSAEDEQSDDNFQSDDEYQSDNISQNGELSQGDHNVPQSTDESQNDNKSQVKGMSQSKCEIQSEEETQTEEEEEKESEDENHSQNEKPLSYDITQKIDMIRSKFEKTDDCLLFKDKCKEIIVNNFSQDKHVLKQAVCYSKTSVRKLLSTIFHKINMCLNKRKNAC